MKRSRQRWFLLGVSVHTLRARCLLPGLFEHWPRGQHKPLGLQQEAAAAKSYAESALTSKQNALLHEKREGNKPSLGPSRPEPPAGPSPR